MGTGPVTPNGNLLDEILICRFSLLCHLMAPKLSSLVHRVFILEFQNKFGIFSVESLGGLVRLGCSCFYWPNLKCHMPMSTPMYLRVFGLVIALLDRRKKRDISMSISVGYYKLGCTTT